MKGKFKAYYIDLVSDRRKGALAALFLFLLLLASFIYGLFVRLFLSCYRAGHFRSYKADCPVISIGNITWGGTGKTPLVEAVAKFLKQQGRNPVVLIRGYGKDEVYMLRDKFKDIPVLAGRDRVRSVRIARTDYAADTIILDDGFQHWRLERDLDIVLIDSSTPFGNRRLIPRGILRESLSSLARADIFVLTRVKEADQDIEPLKEELRHYNPRAAIYEARHRPCSLRSLTSDKKVEDERPFDSAIRNQRIAVVAGIARPQSFARTLSLLGAKLSLEFYFPDHYQYSREDLKRIEKACLDEQIKDIITTEKDAARLTALLQSETLKVRWSALCIKLEFIKDEEKFFRFIKSKSQRPFSVLILSDGKAGHLNQARAVARIIQRRRKELGKSNAETNPKIVEVRFKNRFCQVLLGLCLLFSSPKCRRCLRCLKFCLQKDSFDALMRVPVNIIISAGSSLSGVNLFLSYKDNARKIVLMKPPFLSLARFDLAIVPEHDRIHCLKRDNVLLSRLTPNLIDRQYLQEQASLLRNRLKGQGSRVKGQGPTIGVLIGGDTAKYELSLGVMERLVPQLKQAAEELNSQLLVTTSRRTSAEIERLLKENLAGFSRCLLLLIANEKNVPEAVGGILALSDIIVVSGESISMVSEAVSAEKYVFTFMPEKKVKAGTKQESFLEKLEKEGIVKVIQPDSLVAEVKATWQQRPERPKVRDKEAIYQAVSKVI